MNNQANLIALSWLAITRYLHGIGMELMSIIQWDDKVP